MTGSAPQREYTAVYDGSCNVCSRLVKVLEQRDRDERLEIIPSAAAAAAGRFGWIPPTAYAQSLQVIRTADNQTWQGAAAVERLIGVLPKGRFVSWIFSIPFARPVAEKLYRAFAKNRYRLGCKLHS